MDHMEIGREGTGRSAEGGGGLPQAPLVISVFRAKYLCFSDKVPKFGMEKIGKVPL